MQNDRNVTKENLIEAKISYNETMFKSTLICTVCYVVLWVLMSVIFTVIDDGGEFGADMPHIYSVLALLVYTLTTGVLYIFYIAAFLTLRRESRKKISRKDKILLAATYIITKLADVTFILLMLINSWLGLIPILPLGLFVLVFFLSKNAKIKEVTKIGK